MAGLRCGIEIHQRLATRSKLFCSCSSEARADDEPSGMLKRRLRAVTGELGEVDPAAAFEAGRTREFHYQLFGGTTCLVEQDEQPPGEVNPEALDFALKIAALLRARPVDEVHFMRKTVVDGSATGGFQRTGIVAVEGSIHAGGRDVRIPTISLEEESAGIVEQKEGQATYRLDRLGVPLIEIATDASIEGGREAREVAQAIGLLLRGMRVVQRGLGTIRQDVNVSVPGGARCEIKGVQELELLEKIVENEAERQRRLLSVREELRKRGAAKQKPVVKSVSGAFMKTKSSLLRQALERRNAAVAVKLEGFAGLLGKELMPGHRLGTELSDYAKAAAGVAGILHSDEDLGNYGIAEGERHAIEAALQCGGRDAWALCAAPEPQAVKALAAVHERAMQSFEGVPGETRRATGEITKFMRPLPGAARMYPETDVPPVVLTQEKIKEIAKNLPEAPEKTIQKYVKAGLPKQVAEEMLASGYAGVFEQAIADANADAVFVASTLLQTVKALKREGFAVEGIADAELVALFKLFAQGKLVKSAVPEALKKMAAGLTPQAAVKDGLERLSFKQVAALAARHGDFDKIMREHRLVVSPEDLKKALARKR